MDDEDNTLGLYDGNEIAFNPEFFNRPRFSCSFQSDYPTSPSPSSSSNSQPLKRLASDALISKPKKKKSDSETDENDAFFEGLTKVVAAANAKDSNQLVGLVKDMMNRQNEMLKEMMNRQNEMLNQTSSSETFLVHSSNSLTTLMVTTMKVILDAMEVFPKPS